jgi:ferrous iron transport protein A
MLMKIENTKAYPLAMAGEGERVKIVGVNGGKNLIKRLIAMGMIEDTELKVLQRQRGSGLVVACGEKRLALGTCMVNKIMVAPIDTFANGE